MKLLLVIYSGEDSRRVPELLDRHHAGGYTAFPPAHGVGVTGRRDGTRAWPGNATTFFSIVPEERADELIEALRLESTRLQDGERLHVAALQAESYF